MPASRTRRLGHRRERPPSARRARAEAPNARVRRAGARSEVTSKAGLRIKRETRESFYPQRRMLLVALRMKHEGAMMSAPVTLHHDIRICAPAVPVVE